MNVTMYYFQFLIITSLLLRTNLVFCFEKEITVTIEAGVQECFYQTVKENQVIDIEYQVIDGTHGELDISFQLIEPTGRVLVADFKKSDNGHRIETKVTGDFKFCFDNTFSNFNKKTVFFEIILEGGDDEDAWGADVLEHLSPDELYDVTVQEIQDVVHRVKSNLNAVERLQDYFRMSEARDRKVAEENFFRVNTWSVLQIAVMLIVGFIQVVMLKSLFDNNSKVHKIWKGLSS